MKTKKEQCTFCHGTGQNTCIFCSGTGRWRKIVSVYPDYKEADAQCPICDGKRKTKCLVCDGRGYTESLVFEPVKLDIPKMDFPTQLQVDIPTKVEWPKPSKTYWPPPTPASPEISTFGCVVMLIATAILGILAAFGFERTIVAAEGFFIFAGWAGLRAASLFPRSKSETLETFRVCMTVGFGLCGGLLAAYLVLTTPEGQVMTEWVTAQTIRVVGSLLFSVFIVGGLDIAWRRLLSD
jgi:hypothetical protein